MAMCGLDFLGLTYFCLTGDNIAMEQCYKFAYYRSALETFKGGA